MENQPGNDDEDTLELASKTWNRAINSASKAGFREGIKDGSMSVFQEGFDRGYKEAFKAAFLLGIYKGLSKCSTEHVKHPKEIENLLSKTKRGICYLCEAEVRKVEDVPDKSITELEHCQREHSDKILKIIQDYFNPLLKELNVDIDFLNLHT